MSTRTTGRWGRVTDWGSTVPRQTRSTARNVANLSHPSAGPQKGPYEKQISRGGRGRNRHVLLCFRRVRDFLQSAELDQKTDGEPATGGECRSGKEIVGWFA